MQCARPVTARVDSLKRFASHVSEENIKTKLARNHAKTARSVILQETVIAQGVSNVPLAQYLLRKLHSALPVRQASIWIPMRVSCAKQESLAEAVQTNAIASLFGERSLLRCR